MTHLDAAATATAEPQGWSVELHNPPSEAGADVAAVRSLVATLDRSRGPIHVWLGDHTPGLNELADDPGHRTRTLVQLVVALPLPAKADPGIAVRPFRPGIDDEAWLATNNGAFAWHPEQGGWGPEQLAQRMSEPWFDPEGFLLHEDQGRLAGFCWTKEHSPPDPVGEIYVIAVDPDFQGRGLGRQLTLAGFDHLAGRGHRTGMLWVEGNNHPALALYRDLGMTERTRRRALVWDDGPAPSSDVDAEH